MPGKRRFRKALCSEKELGGVSRPQCDGGTGTRVPQRLWFLPGLKEPAPGRPDAHAFPLQMTETSCTS